MNQAVKTVQHCTNMTEVRCGVDALDDLIVPLLVQRTAYMTQAARIKQRAEHVRDEARIQAIVDRVRQQTLAEGGEPDVIEAIYRSMMEVCIAFEHREFARLRESSLSAAGPTQGASTSPGGSAVHEVTSVEVISP